MAVVDAIHAQVEDSIMRHAEMKSKALKEFNAARKDIGDNVRRSSYSMLWLTGVSVVPFVIVAITEHLPDVMVGPVVIAFLLLIVAVSLTLVLAKSVIDTTHGLCTYSVRRFRDIDRLMDGIATAEDLPPSLRSRAGEVRDRYTVTGDDLARLRSRDLLKLTVVCVFCTTIAAVGSFIVWFYRVPS